ACRAGNRRARIAGEFGDDDYGKLAWIFIDPKMELAVRVFKFEDGIQCLLHDPLFPRNACFYRALSDRRYSLRKRLLPPPQPAAVLRARHLRCLRRMLRLGMYLADREVAEDEAQVLAEASLVLLDESIGVSTVHTLVVTVFYKRHRCRQQSPCVILLAHRQGQ